MDGRIFVGTLLIAFSFAMAACAGDAFSITAQTTSASPESAAVGGSNLPNLVSDLVKGTKEFSGFSNRDFSAQVRYAGEDGAILLNENASHTAASVSISIGFSKSFTGTSSSNLEHQIENYAKQDGADVYGQFIRSVNQNTTLGVSDGNPLAATALFANQAYSEFGLQAAPKAPGNPLDQIATPNIRLDFDGGYSHGADGNGYFAGGSFDFGFKFGDRMGLVFSTPFEYRYIAGTSAYDIAEEISLPIVLVRLQENLPISWMVTPTYFIGGAGSVDLAAGGVFIGGGITSMLSLQFSGFIFTLANHYDYLHGFPISVGDYKFDTNLDQEILKNGIKITRYFGENLYIDGSITYTEFLQHAAVGEYWTPTAGIGFQMSAGAGIRVGYAGDFGRGFDDEGGNVEFYLNY